MGVGRNEQRARQRSKARLFQGPGQQGCSQADQGDHTDRDERRDRVLDRIKGQAKELGEEHGQTTTIELINADRPATCDSSIIAAIEKASSIAGNPTKRLISRAYHDSLFMAQICPTGMIFIPCRNGYSHRPDEYASPQAIAAGVLLGKRQQSACLLPGWIWPCARALYSSGRRLG